VPAVRPTDADLRAAVGELEATGTPRKAAIVAVATGHGLPRREVYNLVHAPSPADDATG
jgi:16S rRNA (cytidine1402-2'-O)-methyltransferase